MTTITGPFGLNRPTVADLRFCLLDDSTTEPQLWQHLCEAAQVEVDTDDPAVLAALIAAALKTTTGALRVTIASLNVRLRAHTVLAAL